MTDPESAKEELHEGRVFDEAPKSDFLRWIEAEAEQEMSKYVSYDGPMQPDLEVLMRKAAAAAWRAAVNIVVLSGPPGHGDFRELLIVRMKARISELESP